MGAYGPVRLRRKSAIGNHYCGNFAVLGSQAASSGFQLAFQLVFQLVDENDPGRPATYSEGCRASRAGR
jgi:hypothetical protein